jgi:DUF4097 and DUF4098 domain-containing protein YvlB
MQKLSPGQVRANTVNGSIHASLGRTDWTGELRVATVNGSVTVELPPEAGTDVTLGTVNGRIDSDFGLAGRSVEPRKPRKRAGTIGAGGRQLKVDTVNGSGAAERGEESEIAPELHPPEAGDTSSCHTGFLRGSPPEHFF